MALKPDVESWEFSDLEELRDEQWTESNTLEYKQDINIKQESDKKQLVKEVCGFANANGGFLIYGVEELEGEPAYPVGIPGIHSDDADTRRVEDVIYSNITPRLHVRMKIIPIPKSENVVLLIYTPEGSAQPYYNWKEKRFHLRYEYKTQPMTEAEIAARYSERFVTEDRIKRYLHDTVIHHRNLVPNFREAEEAPDGQRQAIYGHILIYPSNISRRRVDTSDPNIFEFHDQDLRFPPYENDTGADYRPGPKRPGRFGVEWFRTPLHLNPTRLEVHRNGLIHRADDYGGLHQTQNEIGEPLLEPELYIRDNRICANIIGTLCFASLVYHEIEYLGPIIVRLRLRNVMGIHIREKRARHILGRAADSLSVSPSDEIEIERECNSWELGDHFASIAKNIMDEFANHFGLWTYPEFLPQGALSYLLSGDEE